MEVSEKDMIRYNFFFYNIFSSNVVEMHLTTLSPLLSTPFKIWFDFIWHLQ